MYAVVEIAGQQFKVEKEQHIIVHRLEGEAGSGVEFDNILLLDNDGKVTVGAPKVEGALIKAKIIEHLRGNKITVFHKKRRKGYQKETGHRQDLSKILIEEILTGAKKSDKGETKVRESKPTAEKKQEKVKEIAAEEQLAKKEPQEALPEKKETVKKDKGEAKVASAKVKAAKDVGEETEAKVKKTKTTKTYKASLTFSFRATFSN